MSDLLLLLLLTSHFSKQAAWCSLYTWNFRVNFRTLLRSKEEASNQYYFGYGSVKISRKIFKWHGRKVKFANVIDNQALLYFYPAVHFVPWNHKETRVKLLHIFRQVFCNKKLSTAFESQIVLCDYIIKLFWNRESRSAFNIPDIVRVCEDTRYNFCSILK